MKRIYLWSTVVAYPLGVLIGMIFEPNSAALAVGAAMGLTLIQLWGEMS